MGINKVRYQLYDEMDEQQQSLLRYQRHKIDNTWTKIVAHIDSHIFSTKVFRSKLIYDLWMKLY